MIEVLLTLIPLQLIPLRLPGSGFPASILGVFLALGLLAVVAKFATTKPRNRRRPPQ